MAPHCLEVFDNTSMRQMGHAVDVKASLYEGNALVATVVKGLKQQHRGGITDPAATALREGRWRRAARILYTRA
jgi:hypothetical protein